MKKQLTLALLLVTAPALAGPVHVRSHTTKRGNYVSSHVRTSPDHSRLNNWSTRGNTNPYTGKSGHVNPYRTGRK
jgi:hypothetical protein